MFKQYIVIKMDVSGILCVLCALLVCVTGQGTNIRLQVDSIRLANGNQSAGRVEVQVGGVWGTVCDDQWDNLDAGVVCKQLNYTNGGIGLRNAAFGPGTGPIFIDDTNCDGSEDKIQDCQMKARLNNVDVGCNHTEDAGVICDTSGNVPNPVRTTVPTPPKTAAPVPDNCAQGSPSSRVRLVSNNNNPGEGRLEVLNPNTNTWGSVCDDFFNENTAKVVCRMLCYTETAYMRAGAREEILEPPRYPIILDDVICDGTEAAIQDCQHATWGVTNCALTEAASITCINLASQPPEPPSPILECREGYLIAAFAKSRDTELEEKHLSIANPMTPGVPCNVQTSGDNANDTVVVIRIPFNGCGTTVKSNSTHLIYSNVIKYDYTRTQGVITRVNTYRVEVSCDMPRSNLVTRQIDPQTQVVTQRSTGQFVITMMFFRNNSFNVPVTELPLRIPIGEWLNVALQLESIDSRLKLIVPDCIATPDGNMNNAINYPLFDENCAKEPTLGFFSLNQTRFGYRYQPFRFVGQDQVYLHCGAYVCLLDETSAQCDRSCNSSKPSATPTTNRRKREAPSKEKYFVHSGPMIVYKLDNAMTVLERIGEPQTVTTTFNVPIQSSTPAQPTPHRVETSVKVVHHETSTVMVSGDGKDAEPDDTPEPVTQKPTVIDESTINIDEVRTEIVETTPQPTTTKKSDVTTSRPHVTTKINDVTTRTPLVTTRKIEEVAQTAKSDENEFFLERGGNSDQTHSDQSRNTLGGFVPVLSASTSLYNRVSCILLGMSVFLAMLLKAR